MSADALPAANVLPIHRLIFMPWRWNRVVQGLLLAGLALLPPSYLMSLPIIVFWASEMLLPPFVESALEVYVTPGVFLYENVPLVENLFEYEFWLLESVSEYVSDISLTFDAAIAD